MSFLPFIMAIWLGVKNKSGDMCSLSTHRARNPRVAIQPPCGLKAYRITENFAHFRIATKDSQDTLHDRAMHPFRVGSILEEEHPDTDANGSRKKQHGPCRLMLTYE